MSGYTILLQNHIFQSIDTCDDLFDKSDFCRLEKFNNLGIFRERQSFSVEIGYRGFSSAAMTSFEGIVLIVFDQENHTSKGWGPGHVDSRAITSQHGSASF